jgi:menaquinone-specific isochorismate synthase
MVFNMALLQFERDTLQQAIKILNIEACKNNNGVILSCKINQRPPKNILKNQKEYPKLYWKGKETSHQYLCWGISSTFSSLDQIKIQENFPTFAAFSFDRENDQWKGFPPQQIWQPRWCLLNTSDDSILFHIVSKNQNIETQCGYEISNKDHIPNQLEWSHSITKLKKDFLQNGLSKIVLSRQSCTSTKDLWQLFETLTNEQPDCYHFLYSPKPESAFMGCSPEKLFSISNGHLFTEAIAGTRPRGFAQKEDDLFDKELRNSDKDNIEHNIVTQFITTVLKRYSTKVLVDPRRILRLKNVQHLQTPINAQLLKNFSMDELLHALHPTPAVCGYPRALALSKIRDIESFSRGWYSGTIGMLQQNKTDFTVAIRSALVVDKKLFIWAGAGIVADSDPLDEWREVNAKGKQFFDLAEQ